MVFGTHPHDNMEILTCVLDGTISHKDSMGNEGQINAGEWQLMSAGTGVTHSEMNKHDKAVSITIWIQTECARCRTNLSAIQLNPKDHPNQWHLIAGDESAPMSIRQNAEVKTAVIEKDQHLEITARKK